MSIITAYDIERVDFIEGISLDRYTIDEKETAKLPPGFYACWRKHPTDYMLEGQCDGCERVHKPTNTRCSMTVGRPSPFTEARLYSFDRRVPLRDAYEIVDLITQRHRVVEKVVLKKAGTTFGGFIQGLEQIEQSSIETESADR